MWRWRNCFILILPGVVSGLVVADRKGSVGKFLALLEELNGGVGQDNSRLPYSSADSPSAVRLRQQVLGLTEKILTLGGSPWEEAAALEAAQSGGSGAKLLKKGDGPLNQGHVPGMEDYAPDPPMHDAGCEGALPVSCDPAVPFRTITGLCNNLFHPLWGSASSRLARFVPPVYADGMGSPRGSYRPTICDRAEVGEECPRCFTDPKAQLPNARLVSRMIHPSVNIADRRVTHMVAQFGQFVDHDIALSPEMELEEGEGDCCNPLVDDPGCFPILVPEGDRFIPVDCLDFKRSVVFCQKTYEVREQMNAITAFVDASNVYGSSVDVSLELRETEGGLLRVLDGDGGGGGDLLPMIGDDPAAGGDVRAREQPGLTSMHALFVREHNRVARLVGMANQDLGDEEIYQHTRRIVGAQMQNIVYSHWLPVVLGQLTVRELGLAPDYLRDYYDPKLDPSIRNGFSTAAFRFGHSMIQGMLELFSVDSLRKVSNFQLRENFFDPSVYFDHMEEIIAGLFQQNAQRMDMFVTEDLSNFLFQNLDPNGIGMDLVARNIQRGRDHGLPGYNDFRNFCGLDRACDWSEPPAEIPAGSWRKLSQLYSSPSDVDLFTAGLLETPHAGGLVGRTFNCIIARQFKAIKFGDRFFFTLQHLEEQGAPLQGAARDGISGEGGGPLRFSPEQVLHLMRRGLGDVVCDNTRLSRVPKDAFLADSRLLECGRHNELDVEFLLEESSPLTS